MDIRATRPGIFELGCSQFCGVSHYKMKGELAVVGAGEFAQWMAAAEVDATRIAVEAARAVAEEGASGGASLPRWGWPWGGAP